ncbi:MAG: hypothetical protein IPK92_19035 [Nitrospira sp.]|nr:hypothetical protein [Nitrospira sp.]MBL8054829.1 hypothetical protein [Nitrospira sp.]
MKKRNHVKSSLASTLLVGAVLCVGVNMSACSFFTHGRSVYDREGIRIGVEADPSVRPSSQTGLNNHPIELTPKDLTSLLQFIQVSGYSGTIAGLITKPDPVPLFTAKELSVISEQLATAFREARPTERVFFSLPKPDVTYSEDRTVGALFYRGSYLHVVVTDHSSIIRTDTGGGDYKDIRDTKGMKVWVVGPAQGALLSGSEEPRWAPFEKVHISLVVNEFLEKKGQTHPVRVNQGGATSSVPLPATSPSESYTSSSSPEGLQLQIQELSGTNQELRGRLDEQNRRMQRLQDQVEQLRREQPQSDSSRPSPPIRTP